MIKKFILILAVLLLLLSDLVSASNKAVLPEVIKPAAITVEGNQVYITEGTSIHIYSLNPFKYVKKFGKKGEGPGEFLRTPYLIPFQDHLFIINPAKLMFFSKDGVFQREIKLPFHYFYQNYPLLPVKGNYAGCQLKKVEGKLKFVFLGKIYKEDYTFFKQFYVGHSPSLPPPPRAGTKPVKVDFDVIGECLDFDVYDDKIFVADSRKGLFISVFDHNGNRLYEIDKEYKKIKVPDASKESYMKEQKESENWEQLKMRFNYIFKEYYPAFFTFKINDYKIYVATYEKKEGKYEVKVMDLKGNILRCSFAFLPDPMDREVWGFPHYSTTYDICNNKTYYLKENPASDMWELHISAF
jgi:hypothetical protein